MSCNKKSCCNTKSPLPRAEISLDVNAVAQAFTQMLQVAKTGIDNFGWTSEELAQLAQIIVALVRKPTPAPPVPATAAAVFTLQFGPENAYSLHVPAGAAAQRAALVEQLRAAADQLARHQSSAPLNQTMLPFAD